ncbi:KAP family P-loop NTPase fold protein [Stappia indica]|uniref:KAP family P-loop NTPase fold protein n=1 Tax=Stappia indica TaxID=538381 RepID=UPI0011464002|nr:P-loop NTPase fold protein [Stappia indica]
MADRDERPEIDSPEALEAWLADKPAEWAQVIAVRAALRVFPLVFQVHEDPDQGFDADLKQNLILQVFRASFISRLVLIYPRSEIRTAVSAAAKAAATAANYASAIPFARAAAAAASAARASTRTSAGADVIARAASSVRAATSASTAAVVVHAGGDADDTTSWRAVSEDCLRLLEYVTIDDLIDEPLWLMDVRGKASYRANFPPWVREPFDRFAARDEVKSGPWRLIIDWYRAILPNSLNAEPRSLFGQTVDIAIATQPDAFWIVTDERSAEDVFRDLERIRDGKPTAIQTTATSDQYDSVSGPAGDDDLADGDVLRTDAVPTHSDEPTGDDHLGRRPFARALVERMIEVKQASGRDGFAIHLHAPWGAGKTFILRMMDAMLRQPEQEGKSWIVVHFNAWEHERRKPPWWPMIVALKDAGSGCLWQNRDIWGWSLFRLKYAWWWTKMHLGPLVLAIVALLAVGALVVWPALGVLLADGTGSVAQPDHATTVQTVVKSFDLALKVALSLVAAFGAFLLAGRALVFGSADGAKFFFDLSRDPLKRVKKLFSALVAATRAPVCIFIDDLDRCNADYVVDLLEGIQTSFRHRDVTYVVAADRAWIRASFEQRYSNFSSHVGNPGQPLGYLFLEKIFQVSTPVPGMGGVKQNYWKHLLAGEAETMKADTVEASESWVSRAGERYRRKSILPTAIFDEKVRVKREEIRDEFGNELSEADVRILLSRASTETDRVATILNYSESEGTTREAEHLLLKFSEFLPDNPRVMKRMVNSYKFRRVIGYLESNSVGHEVLARWTILEQRFPALADLLIEHPEWADMLAEGMEEGTDMPQALQPFAGDKDVIKVLGGPGSEHPLREKVIATITRGSAT